MRVGQLAVDGLSPGDAEEFYSRGFLLEAVRVQDVGFGLTSIIIVTFNELDYTRQCVESIRRLTDEPYELIFVDNASTDGTVQYLECQPDAKVIRNSDNRGFPAAVNQGIAAASGSQVLLLNNDTIVTTGGCGDCSWRSTAMRRSASSAHARISSAANSRSRRATKVLPGSTPLPGNGVKPMMPSWSRVLD